MRLRRSGHLSEGRVTGYVQDLTMKNRTSKLHRLDARTRAIGLAGIAEARATLAGCRPTDAAAEDHPEDDPTSTGRAVPDTNIEGVGGSLPEAA